jgi:hypothetical protein
MEIEVWKTNLATTNLMPVHQFWELILTMSQYARGTSVPSLLKQRKDYTFPERMDKLAFGLIWLYEKKG